MYRLLIALFLTFALPLSASAQDTKSVTAYVWGNSLFHHLSNSDDTAVPHWLSLLARADDRSLELDGQWGFVRDFANTLPPVPNWSFQEVKNAWSGRPRHFATSGINTIILNPANFIQYQPPSAPYDGANATNASPISATVEVFSWVREQGLEPVFYIYEGWQELGRFPPTRRAYRRYLESAQGEYNQWFRAYRDGVAAEMPGADVRLIPASSILAGLISDGPLQDLRPTDLYVDGDPHGTETTYFLAGLITYAAVYNAPPPAGFTAFGNVHQTVIDNYPAVVDYIWTAMQSDLAPREQAAATVAPTPEAEEQPATETATVDAPTPAPASKPAPAPIATAAMPAASLADLPTESASQAVGLANPSLAMGLNGIADWSTQHPFIDLMKTARPWVGHKDGQWGAVSAADLKAGGHLDENGWPISIPDDVTQLESFILTDQLADMTSIKARYRVTWEGKGKLAIGGIARADRMPVGENERWFSYSPSGEGLVALTIWNTDPNDHIRNIQVVREDHIALHEAGVLYNPDFVEKIRDLRSIRFMDWTFTNGSDKATWADRARAEHYTFVNHGVPVDYIIHLSNLIGADPWVNMPHLADDDFMRRYAVAMRAGLDPRLNIYLEYSNEVWNFIFPQAVHARDMAIERWGNRAGDDAWMQWAGMRAAQMADIWTEVFAEDAGRLIPTVGVHSGWLGLEEPLLESPLWVDEGNTKPADRFRAYAVTGYFGFELGGDEYAPQIVEWIEDAQQTARAKGEAQGLQRVALREFIKDQGLQSAYPKTADLLRTTSLPELVDTIWPYHAGVASSYGMSMVMYEGGTHVAPHGQWSGNELLSQYMQDFNYSPEIAQIYRELLDEWRNAGGTLYNAFVDIAPPSQYGSWGALRHIDDETARWDALIAFNEEQGAWWETRRSDAFVHGVISWGGNGADTLEGTTEEDILMGRGGNDTFISLGRADHINGGDGTDVVVFPGAQSEYSFARNGAQLLVTKGMDTAHLTAVETLRFEDGEISAAGL